MATTILNLKSDLTGIIHGSNLNKVENILGIINRAARNVVEDVDLRSAVRTAALPNAVYTDIYNYFLPSDVSGNKIIDVFPLANRTEADRVSQHYSEEFDMYKQYNNGTFSVETINNVKFLRLSALTNQMITLHSADSLTENGTWTATNDATNVTLDTVNFVSGTASINFDLTGDTTTATLTNASIDSVDLTDLENVGSLFTWLWLPTGSDFTTVTLRWGNDASNYFARTVTETHFAESLLNGWNLFRFDWANATEVGAVDVSDITWVQLELTYGGDATQDIRFDNIVAQLGKYYVCKYYSNYIFQDGTTTEYKDLAEDDSDVVMLEFDEYTLLLDKCAELIAQQLQSVDSSFDVTYYRAEYENHIARYRGQYKSQVIKPINTYYRINRA